MLYYAHFHSHLNYCSIFFTLLPQKIMKKLITLQKKAVRAIAKASFRAHTEPIFIHLNILPLDSLIQFNLLTFMHKYINFKVPKTFAHTWPTNFEYNNNLREMRRSGDFYIQRCHSNKLKKHPFFNLPLQWNNFVHQTKFILEPLEFKYELNVSSQECSMHRPALLYMWKGLRTTFLIYLFRHLRDVIFLPSF